MVKQLTALIVVLILVAGCSSDPSQSDEYLFLESQKSEVESELANVESELASVRDAANEATAAASADLALLDADIVSLEDELADANSSLFAGSESLAGLATKVEHLVAFDVWLEEGLADELASLGVDTSVADQIVVDRDWAATWASFLVNRGYDVVFSTQRPVDDEALDEAWDTYLDAAIDSDEEEVAYWDYYLLLLSVVLDSLDEALAGVSDSP
jgi:hypothetical protein